MLAAENILETINMIQEECLDIRTITMGISLYDCQSDDSQRLADRIYDKIMRSAKDLVKTGDELEKTYGIPIINKRVSVTPIALLAGNLNHDGVINIAKTPAGGREFLFIQFSGYFPGDPGQRAPFRAGAPHPR